MLNSTAQAYGTGAYHSESAMATERVLLLDETTTTVRQAIERVYGLTGFARTVADSVFGARPEPATGSVGINKLSAPSARADGLRNATNDLHAAINTLEAELDRLRAL